MAGLVPAIHVFGARFKEDVDARHEARQRTCGAGIGCAGASQRRIIDGGFILRNHSARSEAVGDRPELYQDLRKFGRNFRVEAGGQVYRVSMRLARQVTLLCPCVAAGSSVARTAARRQGRVPFHAVLIDKPTGMPVGVGGARLTTAGRRLPTRFCRREAFRPSRNRYSFCRVLKRPSPFWPKPLCALAIPSGWKIQATLAYIQCFEAAVLW